MDGIYIYNLVRELDPPPPKKKHPNPCAAVLEQKVTFHPPGGVQRPLNPMQMRNVAAEVAEFSGLFGWIRFKKKTNEVEHKGCKDTLIDDLVKVIFGVCMCLFCRIFVRTFHNLWPPKPTFLGFFLWQITWFLGGHFTLFFMVLG